MKRNAPKKKPQKSNPKAHRPVQYGDLRELERLFPELKKRRAMRRFLP